MSDLTLALALVGIISIACQFTAHKVKLPAILFLLVAGIFVGPVTGVINADDLFGDLLEDNTAKPAALPIWLSIEVETQDYLNDLQQRIHTMTADMNVEVLQLRRARSGKQVQITQEAQETLNELSVEDVFERRLALERFETEQEQERLGRIRNTFSDIVESIKLENAS